MEQVVKSWALKIRVLETVTRVSFSAHYASVLREVLSGQSATTQHVPTVASNL